MRDEVGFSWFSFSLSSRVLSLEGSSDRSEGILLLIYFSLEGTLKI